MNPLSALLVPSAAVLLAATTLSGAPDGEHVVAHVPQLAAAASASSPAASPAAPERQLIPIGPVPGGHPEPALRGRWRWPLDPRPSVIGPFVAPATRYGAGHRGADLAGTEGQPVLAVAAGTVTHVGTIAGRGTVSVLHASGIRSTYEPVMPTVRAGQQVAGGVVIGQLATAGSHCAPGTCLHLGAIRGEVYLDPLTFLTARRVRLLPVR